MATREELYKKFGPLLFEAITRVILDEINLLRNQAGLPERDLVQVSSAVETKLNQLDKYDWMNDGN